ncbi:MAG: PAS domain S-box protein, partial [Planctomycetia bacterium]|nr:PAS domain S-box protein [Planctomycetia bacterium]
MQKVEVPADMDPESSRRAASLFSAQLNATHIGTDRIFVVLMLLQWVAGILAAVWISPRTWAGPQSEVHVHVWTAIVLGGLITSFPVYMVVIFPGARLTRYSVAIAQMLWSALLIHLTGGRIETHFHVFGSLAFLAFYRDWRVLVVASVVIAGDHLMRGYYWPQSVYGTLTPTWWRSLEHAGWVVFEDVFLFISIRHSLKEMRNIAKNQAHLERSHELTEQIVRERTAELRGAKAELQAMHDASPMGMFMANQHGEFVYVNHMYEYISGLTCETAKDRGWLSKVHSDDRRRVEREWGQAVEQITTYESVHRIVRGGQLELWVSIKAAPVFSGDVVLGYVGTMEDITDRKQAEIDLQNHARELEAAQRTLQCQTRELETRTEQLQEAHVIAERANLAKSHFLANMSHEIRTPMTAILGFADILAEDAQNPEEIEAITTIKRNGKYLLEIINDILDLSKIEAGKFSVEKQRCSTCQIIADAASLMRVPASAKQLPLKIEYVGPIPEIIESDSTRLRQVLINLIGNAIKFTQTGAVRVVIRFLDTNGPPRLQFEILDTGIGMSQEELNRLFQPFTQADASTSRQFGGTGLGLAISQRLAEMMGGSLTVDS